MPRRLVLLLLLTASLLLSWGRADAGAGGGPGAGDEADADLRSAWIVAGGAGAQVRYRVVCEPGDRPVILSPAIHQSGRASVASGSVGDVPCTGEPLSMTVTLRAPTDVGAVPVHDGPATAWRNLWNCVEGRDPCFELEDDEEVELQRRAFRTPFDEDLVADLVLVRSRLTGTGAVRLVHDLSCSDPRVSPVPLQSVVTQVSRQGRLVWGAAVTPRDGGEVACGAEPVRLRSTVSPSQGVRFRAGAALLDSSFGSALEWGVYAADSRVLRLGGRTG